MKQFHMNGMIVNHQTRLLGRMDKLPKVLDELKGKAESLINSIDAGKKAAESL